MARRPYPFASVPKIVALHHQPGRAYEEGATSGSWWPSSGFWTGSSASSPGFPEGLPEGEGWWGDTSTMDYLSLAPASIVRGYANCASARSEALQAFG